MIAARLPALDAPSIALVQLSATIASGDNASVQAALQGAHASLPAEWVEELILQSYLFCGFPRALNAASAWHAISGRDAPRGDDDEDRDTWRARGAATCAVVYGSAYDKLRANVRSLHPVLDDAMLVDGYGRILSRPGLDLARRELCIVAACAVTGQDRQLHSHLRGALNAGASAAALSAAVDAVLPLVHGARRAAVLALTERVIG